jgi:antitoxin component of RelBE/YafQ-DinJ toxin-antitoxin module
MQHSSETSKDASFNLRIDPMLKTAFLRAAADEGHTASQVVRDFMRDYVRRHARRSFEVEAERQCRLLAERESDAPGEPWTA